MEDIIGKDKKKKTPKQGETEEITKKTTDEAKDFKTSGVEGTKDSSPQPTPEGDNKPEIVRIEDVIKKMRAKGYKI